VVKRFVAAMLLMSGFFASESSLAVRTGGTDTVVTSITQTGATFTASITTDNTGSGNYTLNFYVSAPYGGFVGGASPASVAVNGNTTTTFSTTTTALQCGTTYTVSGVYLPDNFIVGNGYTSFTTSACTVSTLSVTNSPQAYTGSAIAAAVSCTSGGAVSNVLYNGNAAVPSAAGTYAITADCAANGSFSALTGASAGNFVISSPPPSAVPTLSEWAQLMLGLMVMMLIGWHFHRERSY
jgi:MBG domain